jgi:rhodanese-related sulfurtransferase
MVEPILPRPQGSLKPAELAKLIKMGKVVPIDIREAAVWQRVRIPSAKSFPEDEIENRLAELHMLGLPLILYCRGGDKSAALAEKLAKQGLSVGYLEGGVLEWEGSGLEMER